eukprot:gene13787-13903_t
MTARHRAPLCVISALVALTAPLAAQTKPVQALDFSLPKDGEKIEYDSEDMFGPTDGTDTSSQGEREFSTTWETRSGKRGVDDTTGLPGKGRYHVSAPQIAVQYGLTDDFSVEVSAFGDLRNVKNVPGLDNNSRASFDGISTQFSYRFLERTRENPLGLGMSFEPRWSRIADTEGVRQDGFDGETKFLADYRLLDGRLWFATNFGIDPQMGKTISTGTFERQSTLTWSNALTARVLDTTFIGLEEHYSRCYNGFVPNQFTGHALFIGPTLLHQFSKSASLKLSLSSQVWGHSHNPDFAGNRLDLFNFEQTTASVKLSLNF